MLDIACDSSVKTPLRIQTPEAAFHPSLIIFDEPTASLDVTSQAKILDLLKDLQDAMGLSYLFISHDLAAVHFMSHRIMVMKDGQIGVTERRIRMCLPAKNRGANTSY